jgi:cell filamentation protein
VYEAHDDPYCYPGTSVLRNRLDLRTQEELDAFEAAITHQRADEPLPPGGLDYSHYLAIHQHLFQDIYEWAGTLRTVRVAKGGSVFCYPEHVDREMRRVFDMLAAQERLRGLGSAEFAVAATQLLADLNAIHPFREGNGRTQTSFLKIIAEQAGHP